MLLLRYESVVGGRDSECLCRWLASLALNLQTQFHLRYQIHANITLTMFSAPKIAASSLRICRRCMSSRGSRIVAPLRPSLRSSKVLAYRQPAATFASIRPTSEGKSTADEAVEKIQELYVVIPNWLSYAQYLMCSIATRQREMKSVVFEQVSLTRAHSNTYSVRISI